MTEPVDASTNATLVQIIALSVLVMVAFGTLFYAYSIFITKEAAGAEYSISLLSVAWTGAVLVGGGFAFLVGRHADQHGVRGIMGLGTLVGAAGLILLGASQSGWQLVLVSWLLIGPAGAMTFYEPAFVAVDQWFGVAGSTRSLATLTVIGGLAGPIFIPLTGFLTVSLGWRWAAVVLAAILLTVGLVTTIFVFPSHMGERHERHGATRGDRPFGGRLRARRPGSFPDPPGLLGPGSGKRLRTQELDPDQHRHGSAVAVRYLGLRGVLPEQ